MLTANMKNGGQDFIGTPSSMVDGRERRTALFRSRAHGVFIVTDSYVKFVRVNLGEADLP